jgi:hypothetical protein
MDRKIVEFEVRSEGKVYNSNKSRKKSEKVGEDRVNLAKIWYITVFPP